MNPDIVVMIICGVTGMLFGGVLCSLFMGAVAADAVKRATRRAWMESARFHEMKEQEGRR